MTFKKLIPILAITLTIAGSALADKPAAVVGPDAASDKPIIIDSIGEVETTFRALGTPGSTSKPSKWVGQLVFFVRFANISSDDVVTLTFLRGKKRLAKPTPCRPKNLYPEHQLAYFDCRSPADRDYAKAYTTKGAHRIQLTYKKVVEGVEHENFATFNVNVEELKKGSSNNPARAWGTNHDMKLAVSTIEEKTESAGQGVNGVIQNALHAVDGKGIPYLSVHTWFKRKKRLERSKITCMYKGKRVAEAAASGGTKYNSWSFVRKGKPDRRDQSWTQAEYRLYSLHPRAGKDGAKGSWSRPQHWMNENPGDYRCVITGDGEIIKELTFTVGADGEIVKPTCQLGSFNALRTVTLVASRDKKLVDGKADLKLGKKAAFEGRVRWAKGCPVNR